MCGVLSSGVILWSFQTATQLETSTIPAPGVRTIRGQYLHFVTPRIELTPKNAGLVKEGNPSPLITLGWNTASATWSRTGWKC